MHSHPYPGLAIIAACLVTLTACRPVPDTTPDPARSSTLAAESVHTELADAPPPSFRMPPPGPFDPNAPGFEPFKPCEDIPDEFLAGLGITKDPKEPDSYEPYTCLIHTETGECGHKGKGQDAVTHFLRKHEIVVWAGRVQRAENALRSSTAGAVHRPNRKPIPNCGRPQSLPKGNSATPARVLPVKSSSQRPQGA